MIFSDVCREIYHYVPVFSFAGICGRVATATVCVLTCCLTASCGGREERGDERTPAEKAALKAIDDSSAVNSPLTLQMIRRGMGQADDSLEYYDYYLRLIRYNVSFNVPDTAFVDWDGMHAFLAARRRTPRVSGMLAFLSNVKGYYNHKFHYSPHETIDLYHAAYRGLFGSDSEDRLPDVCANLGDAYVAVNDMPHAAMWYRRALFLADSLKLPAKDNVSLYMGLGRIYLNLGDFDAALECYRTSDRSFGLMPLNMKLYFLNNYGNYYYYAEDYRSALAVFSRLKALLESYGMTGSYEMYLCKINMADVYLNLGMAAEARRNLDEAEAFFKKIGDETGMYYSRTIRIGLALRDGDVDEVKRILDGERINTTIDFNMVNIRDGYLRDYYVRTGNYKKAYDNLRENMAHNDSLKHNAVNMRTSEIMMRYAQDTLQLHHQIAMQEKDADIRKARWGFYVGVLLAVALTLLLLCLFAFARKRRLQTQMQLMRLKLVNVRGRISPHFIFNVLNNRISKTGKDDADELMGLVRLIRANLSLSGRYLVTLKEEIDFVKYYVSVESQCVEGGINLVMDGPPAGLENVMIPSMFVQILVENSIKHGLKGREGEKCIRITISRQGCSYCHITVADNGRGFDIRNASPASTGTGLRVIRNTIDIINRGRKRKDRIALSIENTNDAGGKVAGCVARLFVPLDLSEKENKL